MVEVFGKDEFEVVPLTHRDLDVTVPESLRALTEIKSDVIVNTAAYVRVDDAELYPEKAFAVNAIGALNVARVAVYISTDYVFDGEKGSPYVEEDEVLGLDIEIEPIKSSELNRLARRPRFSALENRKLHKIGIENAKLERRIREILTTDSASQARGAPFSDFKMSQH